MLKEASMLEYKVVESTIVTDETIEDIINAWVSDGWEFERMQFAMHEGSKRPGMAFVFFVRNRKG
jgi:hypothetical protein